MDEHTRLTDEGDEPELQRPEEAVSDLEPDEEEGANVKGGAFDAYLKYDSPSFDK